MIISQPLLPLCRAEQRSLPPEPTRDHQEPCWDSLLCFSTPWHSLFQLPGQGFPFVRYGKAVLQPPPALYHPSISLPSHSSAPAPSCGFPQHRAGRFSVLCLTWGQGPWDRHLLVLPALVGWVISSAFGECSLGSSALLGTNRAGGMGAGAGENTESAEGGCSLYGKAFPCF